MDIKDGHSKKDKRKKSKRKKEERKQRKAEAVIDFPYNIILRINQTRIKT